MYGKYSADKYNEEYAMPLDFAAKYSTVDVIDLLIDGGADINLTDRNGRTPLHWAAENGKAENIKFLIKRGPSNTVKFVNKQGIGDDAALHKAGGKGYTSVIRTLIEAGADVNMQLCDGCTALHEAVYNKRLEMVKALIEFGADLNLKDNQGETALYVAAKLNRRKMVKTLIENGADVNIKNKDGKTAWIDADDEKIKDLIDNADKIRADYLKKQSKGSLLQTLSRASDNWLKKRISATMDIFRKER